MSCSLMGARTMEEKYTPVKMALPPLERNDPQAAARRYRSLRAAGKWDPAMGEHLILLQDDKEHVDELLKLLREIDREFARV